MRVEEDFPAVNKYGVVKAGDRLAFVFGFGFDFLRYFVVFLRDYENLSAGQASGTFPSVFAVKGNDGITVGAVELDCHTLSR